MYNHFIIVDVDNTQGTAQVSTTYYDNEQEARDTFADCRKTVEEFKGPGDITVELHGIVSLKGLEINVADYMGYNIIVKAADGLNKELDFVQSEQD